MAIRYTTATRIIEMDKDYVAPKYTDAGYGPMILWVCGWTVPGILLVLLSVFN